MRFSEKDIRPEKLIKAVKVFINSDRKLLLKNKKNFIKVACPACRSKKKKFFFKKKWIQILNMHQLLNILHESKAYC